MQYDYIIVGAGSGGCALAGRLARQCPDATIALIEAGPHTARNWLVNTPLGLAALVPFKLKTNYGYLTAPQPGLAGRRGYQPRGRGLGGSSAINAMIYTRGHPLDYDEWASLGCTGWGWSEVLPYFRRAEDNARGENEWHGVGGPLAVSDLRFRNPFSTRFVAAAIEAGYRANDDFNGADQEGVGFYQVTQRDGRRCSVARAYLYDPSASSSGAGSLANVDTIVGACVLRVLFDGARRATGVEIMREGRIETLTARAEVILAAGAFGSPQLLMCSGIGPSETLRALGVPLVHEAPDVGRNLVDHVDFTLNVRVSSTEPVGYSLRGFAKMIAQLPAFLRRGEGMWSSNVAEAGGFIKTDALLDRPDLQLHFCAALVDDHSRRLHWGHGYSVHVCVLRPRSRGTVTLASADARVAPRIDPRFLADPSDAETLLAGVRVALRIVASPALAEQGGRLLYVPPHATDAELREAIARHADTIYHPVGTCRMGSDAHAVVDPMLCVRGVTGLRVVDASVMPTLIGGNTNAPAVMIAERAADFIAQARGGAQSSLSLGVSPALSARV
ncbi:GMC family oxidoreductase [Trinickia dinghuensis]|uniref:GMC family oxidoreductase n=1 Tax=Trinickia dinghuensis TaxID=2291023 RepID=A0A3D8K5L8_9BURK|nr:GMC family oxidoreductase N-terminal domain-containing protein [Trinickia dinghuensis]RDV00196.1 GMC family oxidoreductase [Trinickia dinghuensis]